MQNNEAVLDLFCTETAIDADYILKKGFWDGFCISSIMNQRERESKIMKMSRA